MLGAGNNLPAGSRGDWREVSAADPCPVCGKTSGCKVWESGNVLCRTCTPADAPPDWRALTPSADGAWHSFAPVNGDGWRPDRTPVRRANRRESAAPARPAPLSAERRDWFARGIILPRLGLAASDRQYLVSRGLDAGELDAGDFFSLPGNLRIDLPAPVPEGAHVLPWGNVSGATLTLTCPRGGCLLLVFRDPDGHIVGAQKTPAWVMRLRKADTHARQQVVMEKDAPAKARKALRKHLEKGLSWSEAIGKVVNHNKYSWWSTGTGLHLPIGDAEELSLACSRAKEKRHPGAVVLTEGTSLRTLAIANRWHVDTIGSPGGMFASSPKLLADYLRRLGAATVYLAPDMDDYAEKPAVARTWWRSWLYAVEPAGFPAERVRFLTWPRGKGADDAALAGAAFEECRAISPAEWLAALPDKARSTCARVEPPPPAVEWIKPDADDKSAEEYAEGERLDTWTRLVAAGTVVIDASGTGTGKTWATGKATPKHFGASKLLYVTTDARNPTKDVDDGVAEMPGRHGGLHQDHAGRWRGGAGDGAEGSRSGNCAYADTFHTLRQKRLQERLKTERDGRTALHPCAACEHFKTCANGSGEFDYLHGRKTALKANRIRTRPEVITAKDREHFGRYAVIADEVDDLLRPAEITVTLADCDALADWLLRLEGDVAGTLVRRIRDILRDATGYGLGPAELRAALAPDFERLTPVQIWNIRQITASAVAWLRDRDGVPEHKRPDVETLANWAKELPADWLSDLVAQFRGAPTMHYLPEISFSLSDPLPMTSRVDHSPKDEGPGILRIVLPDCPLAGIVQDAAGAILLSATAAPDEIAHRLGIERERVQVIRQEGGRRPRRIQVTGLGNLFGQSNRTPNTCAHIRAAVAEIAGQYGADSVAVFDFLRHVQAEGYDASLPPGLMIGAHWTDTVGRNDYQTAKAAICIGTPIRHVGATASAYALLGTEAEPGAARADNPVTGRKASLNVSRDKGQRAYQRDMLARDLLQLEGRLRANRRPDETPVVYYLTDHPLPFPVDEALPLAKLVKEDAMPDHHDPAAVLDPINNDRQADAEHRIRDAIERRQEAGEPLTIAGIAKDAGACRQTVRRRLSSIVGPPPEKLQILRLEQGGGTTGIHACEPMVPPPLSTVKISNPTPAVQLTPAKPSPWAATAYARPNIQQSDPAAIDRDLYRELHEERLAICLADGIDPDNAARTANRCALDMATAAANERRDRTAWAPLVDAFKDLRAEAAETITTRCQAPVLGAGSFRTSAEGQRHPPTREGICCARPDKCLVIRGRAREKCRSLGRHGSELRPKGRAGIA